MLNRHRNAPQSHLHLWRKLLFVSSNSVILGLPMGFLASCTVASGAVAPIWTPWSCFELLRSAVAMLHVLKNVSAAGRVLLIQSRNTRLNSPVLACSACKEREERTAGFCQEFGTWTKLGSLVGLMRCSQDSHNVSLCLRTTDLPIHVEHF